MLRFLNTHALTLHTLLKLLVLLVLLVPHECRQVMLTTPNSMYKTGVAVGLVWAVATALLSLYTMYLLSALYLERKRDLVS